MNHLRPQISMLHDYLDDEFAKLESYHFDSFVIKPVDDGGFQLLSDHDDVVHDMMLDFIGYGRPGYEFLSYAENASFPFETSPFRKPPRYYVLYNDDVGIYGVYQEPTADVVPARESCAERKSKALDIVDPVTGEKLQFSIK